MKIKKSLGQNFLVDKNYVNKIINELAINENDLIIEIGAGKGILTKRLKEKKANLIAYEIDEELKPFLLPLEDEQTKIIFADFLNADLSIFKNIAKELKVVGNIPYYITTPIIKKLIDSNLNITTMILMVQKEVANRFMALAKTKEYGYFTLFLRYYFDIIKITDVLPTSFHPIPKVTSTIIKLMPRNEKPKIVKEKYFALLKDAFKQKRKTLKNNLRKYNWSKISAILQENGYKDNVRAEELTEEMFIKISKII